MKIAELRAQVRSDKALFVTFLVIPLFMLAFGVVYKRPLRDEVSFFLFILSLPARKLLTVPFFSFVCSLSFSFFGLSLEHA